MCRALSEQNNAPSLVRAKCFHTLDAFVRLIALLVKHSGKVSLNIVESLSKYRYVKVLWGSQCCGQNVHPAFSLTVKEGPYVCKGYVLNSY
jgi:hypothetical protein